MIATLTIVLLLQLVIIITPLLAAWGIILKRYQKKLEIAESESYQAGFIAGWNDAHEAADRDSQIIPLTPGLPQPSPSIPIVVK